LSNFEPLRTRLMESTVERKNMYNGIFPTFSGGDNLVPMEDGETDAMVAPTVGVVAKVQNNQQVLDEVYRRGFEDGKSEMQSCCMSDYELRLMDEKKNYSRMVESISKQFTRLGAALEINAVRLAIAIADKIMKKEVTIDGSVILHQIREALHRVWGVDMVKLRINPMDEELVREQRSALLAGSDFIRELLVEPDENIERGGCIIESSAGNVDARIFTQLKQIETVFLSQAPVLEKGSL
jgi:flagellar assembly protein FliH